MRQAVGRNLYYSDCERFVCFPFCKVASSSLVSGCSLLSLGKRETATANSLRQKVSFYSVFAQPPAWRDRGVPSYNNHN